MVIDRVLEHRLTEQCPHVVKVVSLVTLSPTLIFFTSDPTSVTIPENSCPNITGGFVLPYSPLNACKSVPQIPESDLPAIRHHQA